MTGGADPGAGLVVAGLHKGFGTQSVLRGIDLSVAKGSITAILGPSGSGKTTLLRLLAGFEVPDHGTISIDGRIVDSSDHRVPPGRRGVGYVPQEGSLFPHLDIGTNIGFGVPRAARRARVAEMLDLIGLPGLAGRFPHQLSGGEQQRVALARALAAEPSLVLLDEPFSSLDAILRTSVRLDVARILGEAGTTTVLVTHDQAEALSMADQIAVLRQGLMAQVGSPAQVYTRPADAAVARFVGDANLVAGTYRDGRVDTPFGSLALVAGPDAAADDLGDGDEVTALIRPEQFDVRPGPADAATPGLSVAGIVAHIDYHGYGSVVIVDIGADAPINVRCTGSTAMATGTAVVLRASGSVTAWAESPGLH